MHQFDIVIPVSYKDCWFLRKNIPYIRKHLQGCAVIYVLTNPICFRELSDDFCDKWDIRKIDENALLPDLKYSAVRNVLAKSGRVAMTGWYFQQFLKMAFALSDYAKDYYLIWDADTIPTNDISFFDGDVMLVNPKKENHTPYFETINKLFGIKKQANYSYISEHMMVKTSVMAELVRSLGDNWWLQILQEADVAHHKQAFSEFETYGTYCAYHYPNMYKSRHLSTLRLGGSLFGRHVSEKELKKLSLDFDTVSFERGEKPMFPRSVMWYAHRLYIEGKYRLLQWVKSKERR